MSLTAISAPRPGCSPRWGEETYYVTHTDGYWRVQDCGKLNGKGHFTDCSELVPTVNEVLHLPCIDGKSLYDVAPTAEFFDSI